MARSDTFTVPTTDRSISQTASKVAFFSVIGLAILCTLLLIIVIALSVVLIDRENAKDKNKANGPQIRHGEDYRDDYDDGPAQLRRYQPPLDTMNSSTVLTTTTTTTRPSTVVTTVETVVDDSNENSYLLSSQLAAGPIADKFYDLNRTAKLSALNTKNGTLKLSDFALSMMNRSADPCNDFYNYACGGFAESQMLKRNESLMVLDIFAAKRRKIVFDMLYKAKDATIDAVKYAHLYATKCKEAMENKSSEANKQAWKNFTVKLIDDFLSYSDIPFISGGDGTRVYFAATWNLSLQYNASVFLGYNNYAKMVYNGSQYGYEPLLVSTSLIEDGVFNESSKLYVKTKARLIEAVREMLEAKQVEMHDTDIEKIIADIFELDRQLAEAKELKMGKQAVPVSNLSTSYSEFGISTLANEHSWSANAIIHTIAGNLEKAHQVLLNTSGTTLGNYMALLTYAQVQDKMKEVDCNFQITKYFVGVLAHLFEKRFPVLPYRANVTVLLQEISESMREIFNNSQWMSEQTKQNAIKKLNASLQCVGYHDKTVDVQEFEALYQNLAILETDTFFISSFKIASGALRNMMDRAGKLYDRTEFCRTTDVTVLNTGYIHELNILEINSAFLQFPLIDESIPEQVFYGAIGLSTGHEFTHGFDSSGSNFGPNGKVMEWWTKEDRAKFKKRTKCLVDAFNRYTDPITKLHENGMLTLPENIADLIGLKAAFTAYRRFVKKHGKPAARMPGFEHLSDEQMFFLSSSQLLCGHKNAEHREHSIKYKEHALSRARVNNIVTNIKEFADAFKCSAGTVHNPTTPRCEVW